MNKKSNIIKRIGFGLLVAGAPAAAFADGDIASTLNNTATTAVSTMATDTGGLLVGAFGIVVGFAVYRLIKKAIGRAG